MDDLTKALTVPCPGCKVAANSACVDIETGARVTGVHQVRIYRAYLVSEAIAENEAYELQAVIERVRELHQPAGRLEGDGYPEGGFAWCSSCGGGGPNEFPVAWPCPTVLALPPREKP